MRKISADYIFPIWREPLKDGILITDNSGEIVDLIDRSKLDYEIAEVERFKGILCPGFVNTHCHLELSYLKNQIPQGIGLNDFILKISQQSTVNSQQSSPLKTENWKLECMESADEEMMNNGIMAVGDISNSDVSYEVKKNSKIRYFNFIEVFGSNPDHAEDIFAKATMLYKKFYEISDCSIVPHSAYSVSMKLFEKIRDFNTYPTLNPSPNVEGSRDAMHCVSTIHHQESEDDNLFFLNKTGKIVERAKEMGIDISKFEATGLKPLASISKYLNAENHVQLVHNTVSDKEDVEYAVKTFSNLWLCLCACSNLYISNRLPDVPMFIRHGCKINIGTDSLASNKCLSVLEEIKTLSKFYPQIELTELLRWATLNGAEYLKIDDVYGSFEKRKRPAINLIENVDLVNLKLTEESRIKVISH